MAAQENRRVSKRACAAMRCGGHRRQDGARRGGTNADSALALNVCRCCLRQKQGRALYHSVPVCSGNCHNFFLFAGLCPKKVPALFARPGFLKGQGARSGSLARGICRLCPVRQRHGGRDRLCGRPFFQRSTSSGSTPGLFRRQRARASRTGASGTSRV